MTVARRVALPAGLLLVVAAAVSPVLAANADVAIVDTSFDPATITVSQGDTVTWTVTKAIGEPHSVTSGTPQDAGKMFDSGINLTDNGQSFQHTFNDAGEFLYFCVVHATTMTGKVVVLAPGASAPPSVEPPPSELKNVIAAELILFDGAVLAF